MIILKNFLKEILSFFILLRFNNLLALREHLNKNGITNGPKATVYIYQMEKRGGFIGIRTKFGGRPYLPHGFNGIFISEGAAIGKNTVIFQGVTIGSVTTAGSRHCGSPIVGDNCYIGAGAKIIGGIKVGNNCRIGANAVVTQDLPDNSTAVCSATVVKTSDNAPDNKFYFTDDKGTRFWDFDTNSFRYIKTE